MATDLDGIFNVGLNGCRDRAIFDKWLEDLKKLNISKAMYETKDGKYAEEEGDWEYNIGGFGGDDPDEDDEESPYYVRFDGPHMFKIILMDDISEIPSYYRLYILFEPPYFFDEFITEVRQALKIFGATELIWLSSLGNASYSGIYQLYVWENTPYPKVKEILINKFGEPLDYAGAKEFADKTSWSYSTLDKFVLDKI
jgi:hypothetical protein